MDNGIPDRDAWLAERRTGIGASDTAAILGISRWGSALGVYLDKLGMLPPSPMSAEQAWGLRHEPAIATAYTEQTGRELRQGGLVRHPETPWLLATPDRLADDRVVELKTCSAFHAGEWGVPGTDEVPLPYLVQVQHQMCVLGCDLADVAVLIGGNDFRVYTVPRSQGAIDGILPRLAEFWGRVERRDPPPPDYAHPDTARLLEILYAPTGGAVELDDDESCGLVLDYLNFKAQAKAAEGEIETLRARLIERMGHATRADLPGGYRINRRMVRRKGYTVSESEYPTFTITPPKPGRADAQENDR